ncbi:hypothetical protein ADUPG1_005996, partial [Aduncisulcus paluster]
MSQPLKTPFFGLPIVNRRVSALSRTQHHINHKLPIIEEISVKGISKIQQTSQEYSQFHTLMIPSIQAINSIIKESNDALVEISTALARIHLITSATQKMKSMHTYLEPIVEKERALRHEQREEAQTLKEIEEERKETMEKALHQSAVAKELISLATIRCEESIAAEQMHSKARLDAEFAARENAERKLFAEAERQRKLEEKKREDEEKRKRKLEEKKKEDEEKRAREAIDEKRREEERQKKELLRQERQKRRELERQRKQEERKKREEAKRREEEEKRRLEAERRRQWEAQMAKKKLEEEERRRVEEEKKRKEEEQRRLAELEQRRIEQQRREELERLRKEAVAAEKKRREEEERKRK